MNFNAVNCSSDIQNMGVGDCPSKIGQANFLIWTTDGFEFATKAGVTLAALQAGIQAKTVYPLLLVHGTTSSDTEDGTYTSDNGEITIPTSKGKWVKEFKFQVPAYLMANIYSFDGQNGRMMILDTFSQLLGTSSDGTKFSGYSVKNITIRKPMLPEDKNTIMTISMIVEFDIIEEYTTNMAYVAIDWADEINGLQDATMAVNSSAAELVTVTVTRDSDNTGITGLVVTDFKIENDEGTAFAIASATPSATVDGEYALVVATMASDDYIVNLNVPGSMTTEGYESTAAATFTIS